MRLVISSLRLPICYPKCGYCGSTVFKSSDPGLKLAPYKPICAAGEVLLIVQHSEAARLQPKRQTRHVIAWLVCAKLPSNLSVLTVKILFKDQATRRKFTLNVFRL